MHSFLICIIIIITVLAINTVIVIIEACNRMCSCMSRSHVSSDKSQITSGQSQITSDQSKITSGQSKITSGQSKITSGQSQITSGQSQITSGQSQITYGRSQNHPKEDSHINSGIICAKNKKQKKYKPLSTNNFMNRSEHKHTISDSDKLIKRKNHNFYSGMITSTNHTKIENKLLVDDDTSRFMSKTKQKESGNEIICVHAKSHIIPKSISRPYLNEWIEKQISKIKLRCSFKDFKVLRTIGTGTFGKVCECVRSEVTRGQNNEKKYDYGSGSFSSTSSFSSSSSSSSTSSFSSSNSSSSSSSFSLPSSSGSSGSFDSLVLSVFSEPFVIKIIDKTKKIYKWRYVITEIFIQANLIHPNIVKCRGWFEDETQIYLVLDKIDGMNMSEYREGLKESKYSIPITYVKYFMKQVVETMIFIKSRGIVYCDLKPENLIIDPVTKKIFICDFGLSVITKRQDPKTKIFNIFGTIDFMSPEIIAIDYIDYGADVWALGATLYEMLYGYAPFDKRNEKGDDITQEMIKKINYTHPGKDKHKHDILYQHFYDLLSKIFRENTSRISIEECAKHPFFT
jgi:serine/threonine protein kinase